MKNFPLVSVIMPTYNSAKYIKRAIDSVLGQTYSNWELIIWDDGSTDATREIVYSYKDDRIKYFFDKNHGSSYARNRAIEVSQGKYLAFLDSDDEWIDKKLAVQVEMMNAHIQIDVLFSDFMNYYESTHEKYRNFEQKSSAMKMLELKHVDHNLYIIKARILESLAVDNFLLPSSAILRKKLLTRKGLFNEELASSEDFELWWRMGLSGVCFAYIDDIYVSRYKYLGSMSSPGIQTYKNAIKVLDACLQETLSSERNELVPYLNALYRNAWQNLIPLFGEVRDGRKMLGAFFQSMKYGITLGSFRLLFNGILSYKTHRKKTVFH